MGNRKSGLQQDQAFLRFFYIDAGVLGSGVGGQDSVRSAFHNPFIIVSWVHRIDGKLEPILSLHSAVAARIVAAPAGENPADVSGETKSVILAQVFNSNLGLGGATAESRRQYHLTQPVGSEFPRVVHLT